MTTNNQNQNHRQSIGEAFSQLPVHPWNPETAAALEGHRPIRPNSKSKPKPNSTAEPDPTLVEAWSPSQYRDWQAPEGFVLAGNAHLVRGGIAVLGGAPGTGKSRASVALAIAGATGQPWFNVPIHARFRTLIVQMENGPFRLQSELADIALPEGVNLDDWLRITLPPCNGLAFDEARFRFQLRAILDDFEPSLVVIDPWNQASRGDGAQKDYRMALDYIQATLPPEPERRPAVLIVHHLRKQPNGGASSARKQGRQLLDELAGSYAIGAAARSAWVMEAATADPEDDRVVLTNCKCNDGPMLPRTAWHRRNGLFAPVDEFDFEAFLGESTVSERIQESVAAVLRSFRGTRQEAIQLLQDRLGKSRTSAYRYLDLVEEYLETDLQGNLVWVEGDREMTAEEPW